MSDHIHEQEVPAGPLAAARSHIPAGRMPARLFSAPAVSRKDSP